jgi:RNA-directed DNA polymerase
MLKSLAEAGAEERRWHALFDKVTKPIAMEAAFDKVLTNKGAAGVDRVCVKQYEKKRCHHNAHLIRSLKDGTYQAAKLRRLDIPKPGSKETRPLGIPTVRDRTLQTALVNVLEPIFDIGFSERSYGFRRGRGCKDALREVMKQLKQGRYFVVDADIKGFFNTISHEKLMKLVSRKIADGKVLGLIRQFLEGGVLEELADNETPQGTPQGGVISPLLANIYLDPLDHILESAGFESVRYADDFVILCKTKEEAENALGLVKEWMQEAELTLHPEKTRISNLHEIRQNFDFLGYRFQRCKTKIQKWPRPKSMKKLKESIRAKTRKCNGHSMECKHSNAGTFAEVDGFVRRRLRSILRKRSKRRGTSKRGADHVRWPNKFFRKMGYQSLTDAHRANIQSPRG